MMLYLRLSPAVTLAEKLPRRQRSAAIAGALLGLSRKRRIPADAAVIRREKLSLPTAPGFFTRAGFAGYPQRSVCVP